MGNGVRAGLLRGGGNGVGAGDGGLERRGAIGIGAAGGGRDGRAAGDQGDHSATTGADGHFQFNNIPAGSYDLSVTRSGGAAAAAISIELPHALVTITVTDSNGLNLGPLPEVAGNPGAAQASAAAGTVGTGNTTGNASGGTPGSGSGTSGGEKLSSQSVSELPLNRRDFSTLLLLAAGTMTDANGATNFTSSLPSTGNGEWRRRFAMDGADVSDPEMGGARLPTSTWMRWRSMQSSSGWMPAEIGRGAAGFTNILTRSGSGVSRFVF